MTLKDADKMNMQRIGERIRRERNKRNISIAKLAAMADIDPTYLNRIEKGTNLSVVFLCRIADSLGIRPESLLPSKEVQRVILESEDPMEAASELVIESSLRSSSVDARKLKQAGMTEIKIGDSILIL